MPTLGRMGIGVTVDVSVAGESGLPAVGDDISGAQALFGFNRMRSDYSGSALKVERSSDGTTLDVGFNDDGSFDDDALTTFVGGGTARLHTLFDQSGNGYDCTQTTDSLQPIITTDADGYRVIRCLGGDFVQSPSFMGAQTNSSFYIVWQASADGTINQARGGIDFAAGTAGFFAPWWTVEGGPTSRTQASGSTEGYSERVWADQKPRMTGYKNLAGTESQFDAGATALSGFTNDAMDYTRITIGKNDFGAAEMDFYELAVWDADVNMTTAWNTVKSNYADLWSFTDMFMVLGDSITTTRFGGIPDMWVYDVITDESISDLYCFSAGGKTIANWNTDIDDVTWILDNYTISGTKYAIIFLGTNDITTDGQTGAATHTRLQTLIASLETAGVDHIIGVTQIARGAASLDAERLAFNALIAANSSLVAVARTDQNANLTDATNTTYFNADQVHMTDAGQDQLVIDIKAAINGRAVSQAATSGNSFTTPYISAYSAQDIFSAYARFNTSNLNAHFGILFGQIDTSPNDFKWWLGMKDGKCYITTSINGTNNFAQYESVATYNDSAWHTLGFTYDQTDALRMYIDGAEVTGAALNKILDPALATLHNQTSEGFSMLGTNDQAFCFIGSGTQFVYVNKRMSAAEMAEAHSGGLTRNPMGMSFASDIEFCGIVGKNAITDISANAATVTEVGTISYVAGVPIL